MTRGAPAAARATVWRGRRPARLPVLLALPAALGLALLVGPLVAIVVQAPWGRMLELVSTESALQALAISLGTAAAATGLSVLLGLPLALLLAGSPDERPSRARRLIRSLVTVPVVLPPVVGGVALVALLGEGGLVSQPLADLFGFAPPPSAAAVVLAQTFVAMPFLVFAIEGAIRAADRRFDVVAATLGASPGRRLAQVTLPLIAPGIAAGAALSFARALGEYGATVTFATSIPGVTQTLPMAIYARLAADDRDAAIALSLVLIAISVVVLVAFRDRWLPGVLR